MDSEVTVAQHFNLKTFHTDQKAIWFNNLDYYHIFNEKTNTNNMDQITSWISQTLNLNDLT